MTVTDQIGRSIKLPESPLRIISLVPSQTELLYDLGLDEEVVGITKFCIYPKTWFRSKTRVGGTKNYKFDIIDSLSPNLIIANKEENEKEQIEALSKKYPVWTSDIKDLAGTYDMIQQVGMITGKSEKAAALIQDIQKGFTDLEPLIRKEKKEYTAVYIIWKDPIMSIGEDTFIHHLLDKIGLKNLLEDQSRYPIITEEALKALDPDLILLSSEPFPFKEKHIKFFQDICPQASIRLVDGESFSWYGSRLLYAVKYFRTFVMSLS